MNTNEHQFLSRLPFCSRLRFHLSGIHFGIHFDVSHDVHLSSLCFFFHLLLRGDMSFDWTYLTRTTLCHTLTASGSQNVRQWSFLTRQAPSATESVNSRGRRRSMWACAFRATFISSISFIYLLILLYSHSFSKHCHSLHRETFEGGGTESFSENGQARRQVLARPQVDPIPLSRHPSVREDELGGLHTHTHLKFSP